MWKLFDESFFPTRREAVLMVRYMVNGLHITHENTWLMTISGYSDMQSVLVETSPSLQERFSSFQWEKTACITRIV